MSFCFGFRRPKGGSAFIKMTTPSGAVIFVLIRAGPGKTAPLPGAWPDTGRGPLSRTAGTAGDRGPRAELAGAASAGRTAQKRDPPQSKDTLRRVMRERFTPHSPHTRRHRPSAGSWSWPDLPARTACPSRR